MYTDGGRLLETQVYIAPFAAASRSLCAAFNCFIVSAVRHRPVQRVKAKTCFQISFSGLKISSVKRYDNDIKFLFRQVAAI